MIKNNKQGFTLVELIVVITILAILGTIAFISLQGYSAQARDSKRLSDIQNIKKSLELFSLNTGKYPLPDSGTGVLYAGEILWTQGIVGDTVTTNLSRNLNIKPTDPLTETEYTYSTINSQTKYELLSSYESDLVSYNNLLNGANAGNANYPKINGNYNGIFVKADSYYIPTPSIITSEDLNLELDFETEPLKIKSQIITGGENNLVNGTNEAKIDGLPNFTLQAFSGTLDTDNGEDDNGYKEELANKLILAYSGTLLANNGIYKQIVETELVDFISLIDDVVLSSSTYVSSGGGTTTNYSCATTPSFSNIGTTTIGTPISVGQAWTYNEVPGNCTYVCTNDFTGTNCEIASNPYANCTGVNTPIVGDVSITATTTYGLCDMEDIIVCSGNEIGYTIAACNVGTNTAGTGSASYGGLYQWGNNADFRGGQFTNGDVYPTTSGTRISLTTDDSTYDNPTFITGNSDWTSSQNNNLWGNGISTDESRKGPCAEGYHVPTKTEWQNLAELKWDLADANLGTIMSIDLKMPLAGNRGRSNSNAILANQGSAWLYWSSSPDDSLGYFMYFDSTNLIPSHSNYRANGFSVRCFKN